MTIIKQRISHQTARVVTSTEQEMNAFMDDATEKRLVCVVGCLKELTFVAETVAHLRGLERELLPYTDAARALIAKIEGHIESGG